MLILGVDWLQLPPLARPRDCTKPANVRGREQNGRSIRERGSKRVAKLHALRPLWGIPSTRLQNESKLALLQADFRMEDTCFSLLIFISVLPASLLKADHERSLNVIHFSDVPRLLGRVGAPVFFMSNK